MVNKDIVPVFATAAGGGMSRSGAGGGGSVNRSCRRRTPNFYFNFRLRLGEGGYRRWVCHKYRNWAMAISDVGCDEGDEKVV